MNPRARIALALSILGHADGHEARAIDEAVLALQGATLDELAGIRLAREGGLDGPHPKH